MHPSQQSKSVSTQIGELDKKNIDRLFATMKIAYPNFLIGQDDDDLVVTKRMWHSHLISYSPSSIEKAARQMIDQFPTKAPTIGQFKQLIATVDFEGVPKEAGPQLCMTCRSYFFTQHHKDICVTGKKRLQQVTDEQIAATKKLFARLR